METVKLLHALGYLGILAVVIGSSAYLFATRRAGTPEPRAPEIPPDVLKRAEQLGGRYRLSDLESILVNLASLEAWGVVLEVQLLAVNDIVQAIVNPNGIELTSHNRGVFADHLDRFRSAAAKAGLEVHPVAGQEDICYVEITSSWPEVAATMLLFIDEIYNPGDSTEIDVTIFR